MTKGTTIFEHVVDYASTVSVDVNQTAFGPLVGDQHDLQTCLELIDEHALQDTPTIPPATEVDYGLTKHATESEVVDPTNDSTAVTPQKLQHWLDNAGKATNLQYGPVQLITEASIDTTPPTSPEPEAREHVFTLKTMNYLLDTKLYATESNPGVARLATEDQAITSGSLSTTVAMTPLRTKQMLDVWANTTASSADETTKGLIRLANGTEVNDTSSSTEALAISPYRFNNRTATTTRKAGFYLPTQTVADARTSNEHAVTVGTLGMFEATATRPGVAKLINNVTTNDPSAALAASAGKWLNDNKIGEDGGTVLGKLLINDVDSVDGTPLMRSGRVQSTAMLNMYPVGAVYTSVASTNPATLFGGSWTRIAQGRVLVGEGSLQGRTFNVRQTGGQYEVVLTEATMPTHKHAGWGAQTGGNGLGFGIATQYGKNNIGSGRTDYDNYLYYSEPKGGGQAHNNIQPYYVVYMWERTA